MRRYGGASGVALKKRLALGRVTPEDQKLLDLATTIRAMRGTGKTWRAIAAETGETLKRIEQFAARGKYHVLCEHLAAIERGDKPVEAAAAKADHRGVIARLVPKALRRLELALNAGEQDGFLVESKTADHAMDTVLEAAGLLEPEGGAVRPVIHIDTLVIQQLTTGMDEDERRSAAIDITPQSATG
jgi:hypothetical protein